MAVRVAGIGSGWISSASSVATISRGLMNSLIISYPSELVASNPHWVHSALTSPVTIVLTSAEILTISVLSSPPVSMPSLRNSSFKAALIFGSKDPMSLSVCGRTDLRSVYRLVVFGSSCSSLISRWLFLSFCKKSWSSLGLSKCSS